MKDRIYIVKEGYYSPFFGLAAGIVGAFFHYDNAKSFVEGVACKLGLRYDGERWCGDGAFLCINELKMNDTLNSKV